MRRRASRFAVVPLLLVLGLAAGAPAQPRKPALRSADLYQLKSVSDVQLSPDGRQILYGVQHSDRPGRPYQQAYVVNTGTGIAAPIGTPAEPRSGCRWSPHGSWIACFGRGDDESGLVVSAADGSNARLIAKVTGTNHPLPGSGERLAWSPDGRQIAFVSSTPGPELDEANGDPMVITRYLYKPTASEGLTRFNDNRRLHIFVADIAAGKTRQLTDGRYYEHSISWSPRGDEIAFVSNRAPDPDRFFNNDIFAVRVAGGTVRRLTDTKNAEYQPTWSPDGRSIAYLGTTRPLTSSETTMEDTHVWVIDATGGNRMEAGRGIDNRQGRVEWSREGDALYFTVQERGNVRLYRLPAAGGQPEAILPARGDDGNIVSWSVSKGPVIACAMATRTSPAELFISSPSPASQGTPSEGREAAAGFRPLTSFNRGLLSTRAIAEVEGLEYSSRDGMAVQAFLTRPLQVNEAERHPMIAMIKGGPHGQQGPAFNAKAQIYAGAGYAVLMVNYRGSTGYGQAFTDAIFNDQNGSEAQDVLAGVDAALARHKWIDPGRLGVEGGSYGGQLTNWLITQTNRFKAAVPSAGISNLVTQNYLSYYHDYLAVEFGAFPHEQWRPNAQAPPRLLMDFLWERSPIRYVANVKTPVLFLHGENDNDVPIAEAEQFYIALKDVGVDTVMIRYPREGHGVRETGHVADSIERSLAWYEKHFKH